MKHDPGLASWLQLTLTPGLGASTLRDLLTQFGLPDAVLARRRSELVADLPPAALEALDSTRVRDLWRARSTGLRPIATTSSRLPTRPIRERF